MVGKIGIDFARAFQDLNTLTNTSAFQALSPADTSIDLAENVKNSPESPQATSGYSAAVIGEDVAGEDATATNSTGAVTTTVAVANSTAKAVVSKGMGLASGMLALGSRFLQNPMYTQAGHRLESQDGVLLENYQNTQEYLASMFEKHLDDSKATTKPIKEFALLQPIDLSGDQSAEPA